MDLKDRPEEIVPDNGFEMQGFGGRQRNLWLLSAAASLFLLIILATPAIDAAEWKDARTPRQWSFPRDHGSHGEFRTEWWYFTGNVADGDGRKYGYQLTFFRHALVDRTKNPGNPWSVRDVYLAHFAVTDVPNNAFHYRDRISRRGPGLAGASAGSMNVHVLAWSAVMKGGRIILNAAQDDMRLDLELVPSKPVVLHGMKGASRKGPMAGQSSYYYSFTSLKTSGTIKAPGMKAAVPVTGTSWFDQEFGSNQLSSDQAGWDWFAVHLDDGRDLMVYRLRRKDGAVERESSGTLVERDGTSRHLRLAEIETTVLDWWQSPKTRGRYPSAWRIRVPSAAIDLTIKPLVADQELVRTVSAGITYWEGAVAGKGTSKGKDVSAEGYVELTGYAGTLGGVF